MSITFTTNLIQAEGKNATGISVPGNVISALGTHKKPKIKVTINSRYTYRSTVAAYRDVYMIPLSAEHRNAAGIKAGDEIEVTLELDEEPRTVDVPDDLAVALTQQPGIREAFDALSYSKRKEFVRQVEDAKSQETRERRIAGVVAKVGAS